MFPRRINKNDCLLEGRGTMESLGTELHLSFMLKLRSDLAGCKVPFSVSARIGHDRRVKTGPYFVPYWQGSENGSYTSSVLNCNKA